MTAIDDAAFADLVAMTGDDAEFLSDVIDMFLEDAPLQVDAMRTAVATGDAEWLMRAAHTLKSTSLNLGALSLASVAGEIETCGRAGVVDGVQDRLAAADRQLVAVMAELRRRRPDVRDRS